MKPPLIFRKEYDQIIVMFNPLRVETYFDNNVAIEDTKNITTWEPIDYWYLLAQKPEDVYKFLLESDWEFE